MTEWIRTFGNGGRFGFTGRFRNRTPGPYRAFATDGERTVVIELRDGAVVVTPDRPEVFAEILNGRTAPITTTR